MNVGSRGLENETKACTYGKLQLTVLRASLPFRQGFMDTAHVVSVYSQILIIVLFLGLSNVGISEN